MSDPVPSIGFVYVVDDDIGIREGLDSLLRSVGYEVITSASAEAFLRIETYRRPSCLVLDVRMQGLSGLDLQARLNVRGQRMPIVMLTAHGDVLMCATVMKAGAADFILKPFREQELLDAVARGLAADRGKLEAEAALQEIVTRAHTLTERERKVMLLVVQGLPNKAIAERFDLSEITIKLSRARMMRKMAADSLPSLVRMADALRAHSAA